MKRISRSAEKIGGTLKEVTVKATKIKMVWRGDTLVYNADAFNVPEGSMLDGLIKQLPGVELKDNWEIGYGLNGNYKLPWNFTFDTDMTFHTRRGYTDSEMNDTRLYWDASLTKSFKQGKWLLKLRGYDLLGQVSSLRYWVSSEGRTEIWTNSMRRYALLTVSYRFSQKPKKETGGLD